MLEKSHWPDRMVVRANKRCVISRACVRGPRLGGYFWSVGPNTWMQRGRVELLGKCICISESTVLGREVIYN